MSNHIKQVDFEQLLNITPYREQVIIVPFLYRAAVCRIVSVLIGDVYGCV